MQKRKKKLKCCWKIIFTGRCFKYACYHDPYLKFAGYANQKLIVVPYNFRCESCHNQAGRLLDSAREMEDSIAVNLRFAYVIVILYHLKYLMSKPMSFFF